MLSCTAECTLKRNDILVKALKSKSAEIIQWILHQIYALVYYTFIPISMYSQYNTNMYQNSIILFYKYIQYTVYYVYKVYGIILWLLCIELYQETCDFKIEKY